MNWRETSFPSQQKNLVFIYSKLQVDFCTIGTEIFLMTWTGLLRFKSGSIYSLLIMDQLFSYCDLFIIYEHSHLPGCFYRQS